MLGRLGGHPTSSARYFHTRSIWRLRGVLSYLLVHGALGSPLVNAGILKEQFWLRIDGFRIIINLVIVYICLVR